VDEFTAACCRPAVADTLTERVWRVGEVIEGEGIEVVAG
jgi:hypothetical protein